MSAKINSPTGPYQVGCSDVVTHLGKGRHLFRLFYPADVPAESKDAVWLTNQHYARGFMEFSGVGWLTCLFESFYRSATMPAVLNAPFSQNCSKKLPVIVFSHGLGANRTSYTNICTQLASLGVFVVMMEHADGSASATFYYESNPATGKPDKKWIQYESMTSDMSEEYYKKRNRQLHERVEDCCGVLKYLKQINAGDFKGVNDQVDFSDFKGNLDFERCALIGHSFGAATTVSVLSKESDFKVAVVMDIWTFPLNPSSYETLQPVPMLFINSQGYVDAKKIEDIVKLKKLHETTVDKKMVTILQAVHQFPTDFALLLNWQWISKRFALRGEADPWLISKVNNELIAKFIGKELGVSSFGGDISPVVASNAKLLINGTNLILEESSEN